MKMVAGARLARAQQRILELRPYAVKTQAILSAIAEPPKRAGGYDGGYPQTPGEAPAPTPDEAAALATGWTDAPPHPLLVERPEKRVLLVVLTSDRGLCGAFNTNINKRG